tara:strand:- start:1684 stop:1911 length:228 start_codon:yes stop_codon:yes gene_type:complete
MKRGDLVAWDVQSRTQGFIVSVYCGTQNPLVGEELLAEVFWFSAASENPMLIPQVASHPASFLYLLSEGSNEEGK